MIIVTGDSYDVGGNRDRGEWIESHSQATSQFYSIIEYPVEGGIYRTVSGEYIADGWFES